ncbi:glycine cleavage system aminomethyltransferase GcvT [Pseudomonas aeruginosa]|uniref:glycine cleavage T C-terminal barrel domain-containing protein n=1 Tax=Pseudomonas aeruginosa TaxID=287 RepID=UPI001BD641F7|nr:glycine cleavage T C-terminal barrel domain-containing protein [Pseudomonas aeruginosa]MCO2785645.1 glycine cleavage system aminomethyltransferase GcvT [Pseudomonas aeruginosa]
MTAETLAKTPLHALHLELGAKMVPFAGYDMPVQYPAGVLKEHLHTREQAGLFDVSHMGQIRLVGADAALALESLVPVDILDLPVGQQRYALFTDEQGGILDDLMVANLGDCLLLVVNAACKHQDLAHLRRHLEDRCSVEPLFEERALLALQGPAAVRVLERLAPQVAQMTFMQFARVELLGQQAPRQGLGARDSLRLEAGLCLYGHDMDSATTPVEASLGWAISKARRADGVRAGGFPGAERIFAQQAQGVASKRVGFLPQGRMPVREGAEIVDAQGRAIGKVSSGGFGPSLNAPLAMGYVPSELAGLGSEVTAMVRGKPVTLVVSKMPFVAQRYYRG